MNEQPEPCRDVKSRCRSPLACSGFGYCRNRNKEGLPTDATAARWREAAALNKAEGRDANLTEIWLDILMPRWRHMTHLNDAPQFSDYGTMLDDSGKPSGETP